MNPVSILLSSAANLKKPNASNTGLHLRYCRVLEKLGEITKNYLYLVLLYYLQYSYDIKH